MFNQLDFETWQQWECQRLNITKEQHDRILEIVQQINCAGLGWQYDRLIQAMQMPSKPADFAELAKIACDTVSDTGDTNPDTRENDK